MEGIGTLWVIILVISAIVRIINKGKKTPAKQSAAPASRRPNPETAGRTAPTLPQPQIPQPAASAPRHTETTHRAEPLQAHMHEPVMGIEGVGTEGIDCCHEYMLSDTSRQEETEILPFNEETNRAQAQALLQGVIFSEILGRRPVKRYGGKQA